MSKLTFGHRQGSQAIAQVQQLTRMMGEFADSGLANKITETQTRHSFAMEGLSDREIQDLEHTGAEVLATIDAVANNLGMESLTEAQKVAAGYAAMFGNDVQGFYSRELDFNIPHDPKRSVLSLEGVPGVIYDRPALEAYDPKENRNAQLFAISYNLLSARQDDFGETLYPTLVVPPSEVGVEVTLDRFMVFDGYERKISGAVENWNRKNLIRALADHTILHKDQNRVIPVVRTESQGIFVDPNLVAPRNIKLETGGEVIVTAPLKFGAKIDLLGCSQTDSVVRSGIMDHTDQLEPAGSVDKIYVKFGQDVLLFDISNLPLSNFTYMPQGDDRWMNFNFKTGSILINKDRKNADGSDLVTLAAVKDNDLAVRVELVVQGSLNLDTSEIQLFANGLDVRHIRNAQSELLDLETGAAKTVVDIIRAGEPLGYETRNYLTNSNIRMRGQLLDNVPTRQLFNVPLRSPIAKMRPINQTAEQDAGHLQALTTATRFRLHNECVTALQSYTDTLREYVYETDSSNEAPDVLGIGRHYVIPRFVERYFDVAAVTNSMSSHQRIDDVQATLVNLIRDVAFNLHRDSEYQAGSEALYGGVKSNLTVVLATDQVTARYLQIKGDIRLMNDEFPVKIVHSLDRRMKGKIFITFAVMDESRNSAVNPLNSGNLLYSPEAVIATQVSRNGQTSHEMIVTPRYLFVNHLPVFGLIHVENLSEAMVEKIDQSVVFTKADNVETEDEAGGGSTGGDGSAGGGDTDPTDPTDP